MRRDEVAERLGKRLKRVRKRKRARRDFACEAVALKMRLVKAREKGNRQS